MSLSSLVLMGFYSFKGLLLFYVIYIVLCQISHLELSFLCGKAGYRQNDWELLPSECAQYWAVSKTNLDGIQPKPMNVYSLDSFSSVQLV